MAKEMMIVFVYDTELCHAEDDDPADAVLYFHPGWVSDQQRLALCGQLMGTTHFLSHVFGSPKIISLQSGKFVIKSFGRYILAVGTDRNIPDWVLEHRADLLTSLVQFFHCDLQTIANQFITNQHTNNNFPDKLYHMFETYLPILQYGGSMFQCVPTIRLPKSGSSVFLEAMQTLQSCQQIKGVLGGTILYQNKVVATQLTSSLTKRLVITDPHRIKSPAENVTVDFHLPVDVQILVVYVEIREYKKLCQENEKARKLLSSQQKTNKKNLSQKITKEPVISGMKRDKSIIFSTVPEEDTEHESSFKQTNVKLNQEPKVVNNDIINTNPILPPRQFNRPTHLPLRFKNVTSRDIPESGFCTAKLDDDDAIPEFKGETSVCSTPMTELNKVLYGRALSICGDQEENKQISDTVSKMQNEKLKTNFTYEAALEKLKITSDFFINPFRNKRRASLSDVEDKMKKFAKRFSMRAYGIGLSKLNQCADDYDSPNENEFTFGKKIYNTITDPSFPVFTNEGLPLSRSLFEEYLECHYRQLNFTNSFDNSDMCTNDISDATNNLEGFDSEMVSSPKKDQAKCMLSENKENCEAFEDSQDAIFNETAPTKENAILNDNHEIHFGNNEPETDVKTPITPMNRRKLSLPLKSLTTDSAVDEELSRKRTQSESSNLFDSPIRRRNLGGIPLTPLMSKLSILAMDEKSSGFCSRDTTPSEFREFAFTPSESKRKPLQLQDDKTREKGSSSDAIEDSDGLQRVELFVCGQQNMTMMLILEDMAGQDPDIIHSLWETSVGRLPRLETHLGDSLGASDTGLGGNGGYSFLCVDPEWDTLWKGGPWGPQEMMALGHMHKDFAKQGNVVEIVLRNDESILYGYQCGKAEVYYQQTAESHAGLPTPADLMGTVPLRARRRLERDHAIILL